MNIRNTSATMMATAMLVTGAANSPTYAADPEAVETVSAGETLSLPADPVDAPSLDTDLQEGLVLWLDAGTNLYDSAGAAISTAGTDVAEWYDVRESAAAIAGDSLSFNRARSYTTGSFAAVPPVSAAPESMSGRPAVDFGDYGSGKWMIFDSAAGGTYPRLVARSHFAVVGFGETCNYPLGSVNGPTLQGGETCFTRATPNASWGNISDGNYAASVLKCGETRLNGRRVNPIQWGFERNSFQILSQVGPGAVQRSYVNATWPGTIPWAKTLFNDRNYKPSTVSIARQGGGVLCELLIFNRVVSDTERRRIESYLAQKWFGESVAGAVALAGGATLDVNTDDHATVTDASGDGSVAKSGSGTLRIDRPQGETAEIELSSGAVTFGRVAGRTYLAPVAGVAISRTGVVSAYDGQEGGSRLAVSASSASGRFEISNSAGGTLVLAMDPASLGTSDVAVLSGEVSLSPRANASALAATVPTPGELETAAEAERARHETTTGNLVSNGSFEQPVRSGWGAQDPTGWTRSGNAYLCNGVATPWWTRSGGTLADGNQFVACQSLSSSDANGSFVTQTFSAPFAGLYRANVRMSQRHTDRAAHALVKVDGAEAWYRVIEYKTDARGTSDNWLEYEIALPPLTAGEHTISLGIAHVDTTDRAALYDAVRVYPVAAGEFVSVPNPGFEAGPTPSTAYGTATGGIYPGRYQYTPASTHTFWTFKSGGITQQDAPWWRISTDGTAGYELRDLRKAFLQLGSSSTEAYAETTINAPRAGRVRLSMRLSKRYNNDNLGHWLDIVVGGSAVGRAWPVGNAQKPFACEFDIDAGEQTLRISMGRPTSMSSQDLAIVFDDIRIQYIDGETARSAVKDPARGAGDLSGWTVTGGAALVRNASETPNGVLQMPDGTAVETSFTLAEGGSFLLEAIVAGAARNVASSNGVYNSYLHYPARAVVTVDNVFAGVVQAEKPEFERIAFRLPYLKAGTHSLRLARETVNHASSAILRVSSLSALPVAVEAPANAADATLRVASGAKLRLDYPETIRVKKLRGPDGTAIYGRVDALSYPDFITGAGSLKIVPGAFVFVVR